MIPLQVRFLTGPRRGQTAAFHQSPVRIGRSRANDLLVPELDQPLSSGRHAEFVFEDGHWHVVDLDSTNGTRLNGAPVRRARLGNRDRILLGDHEVEVRVGRGRRALPAVAVAAALALMAGAGYVAWTTTRAPLDTVAGAARRSVYLLVVQEGERRTAVGTAFAVDRGRLATNAHVAAPIARLLADGPTRVPYAVSADSTEAPRRITGVTLHPGWIDGSIADDVALVSVGDGPALSPLPLARPDQAAALAPGAGVAIFGFPAAATDMWSPQGTLTENSVREIRGARFLLVDMAVAPGSSGSPVLTTDGSVVGIIAGSGRHETGKEAARSGVALSVASLRELLGR